MTSVAPLSQTSVPAPLPAASAVKANVSARAADGDYKTKGVGHEVKDADGDYKPTNSAGSTASSTASSTLSAVTALKIGG